MRADTLKAWLEEKGCRFEEHSHQRGSGHASVVVKLEGKESILPMIGTTEDLDHAEIERIVKDLGLDVQDIPGHTEDEKEKYRHRTTSRA